MSDNNTIVIRAEDDSVVSDLMRYINEAKEHQVQSMGNHLLEGNDRAAAINAARIFQLDEIVDVLREAIEERTKGDGDIESTEPTRITN